MDDRVVYFILCLAVVITATGAQQFHQNTRYGKRSEMDSGSSKPDCGDRPGRSQGRVEARNDRFFLGSRYGKRNYGIPSGTPEENWSQVNQPSLRNDRFFIGSRYGKRDPQGEPEPSEPDDTNPIVRLFQPPCPVIN